MFVDDCFLVASYLTDPVCKSHEYYRRANVVEALNPTESKTVHFARKIFLLLASFVFACMALFTTLPGIALRGIATTIQDRPFLFKNGDPIEKRLPEDCTFSLLSWNICCVSGGYTITDGGVIPWEDRIDSIIEKIIQKDADVNCLYETFDPQTALRITEKLKERGYSHFYYNIGARAIGVTSGIMIASKYAIKDPEFTLFPQETLVGRTKNASKGVFSFDLASEGISFARIFSTHLQHSEEPEFPTTEEKTCRRKQMEIIIDKVDKIKDRCLVVTGDLNLDDNEYLHSPWHYRFQKGDNYEKKTWGGDAFCATLMGKRISNELNLDHTMILGGEIATTLLDAGYDATILNPKALSDHNGIFSQIKVRG